MVETYTNPDVARRVTALRRLAAIRSALADKGEKQSSEDGREDLFRRLGAVRHALAERDRALEPQNENEAKLMATGFNDSEILRYRKEVADLADIKSAKNLKLRDIIKGKGIASTPGAARFRTRVGEALQRADRFKDIRARFPSERAFNDYVRQKFSKEKNIDKYIDAANTLWMGEKSGGKVAKNIVEQVLSDKTLAVGDPWKVSETSRRDERTPRASDSPKEKTEDEKRQEAAEEFERDIKDERGRQYDAFLKKYKKDYGKDLDASIEKKFKGEFAKMVEETDRENVGKLFKKFAVDNKLDLPTALDLQAFVFAQRERERDARYERQIAELLTRIQKLEAAQANAPQQFAPQPAYYAPPGYVPQAPYPYQQPVVPTAPAAFPRTPESPPAARTELPPLSERAHTLGHDTRDARIDSAVAERFGIQPDRIAGWWARKFNVVRNAVLGSMAGLPIGALVAKAGLGASLVSSLGLTGVAAIAAPVVLSAALALPVTIGLRKLFRQGERDKEARAGRIANKLKKRDARMQRLATRAGGEFNQTPEALRTQIERMSRRPAWGAIAGSLAIGAFTGAVSYDIHSGGNLTRAAWDTATDKDWWSGMGRGLRDLICPPGHITPLPTEPSYSELMEALVKTQTGSAEDRIAELRELAERVQPPSTGGVDVVPSPKPQSGGLTIIGQPAPQPESILQAQPATPAAPVSPSTAPPSPISPVAPDAPVPKPEVTPPVQPPVTEASPAWSGFKVSSIRNPSEAFEQFIRSAVSVDANRAQALGFGPGIRSNITAYFREIMAENVDAANTLFSGGTRARTVDNIGSDAFERVATTLRGDKGDGIDMGVLFKKFGGSNRTVLERMIERSTQRLGAQDPGTLALQEVWDRFKNSGANLNFRIKITP